MREMNQEVLRRQNSVCPVEVSERWTKWAKSLAERRWQTPARLGVLAMTVIQPPIHFYLRCQRWQSYAWRLCPQVNLSIAPILRETIWKESPVLQQKQVNDGSFVGNNQKEPAVHKQNQWGQATPVISFASAHDRHGFTSRDIARGGEEPIGASITRVWDTPLRKVFERIDEIESVKRLRRQSWLTHDSLQILQRVVHQGQRVEVKSQEVTAVRHLLQRQLDRPALDLNQTSFAHQSNSETNRRSWPQATSAPAINIEQLTDQVVKQIDRRLLAWRERTGRVF
jgi:hypothetical protein